MAQAQHSLLLPERLAQVRDMLRASRVVRLDEVCVALGVSQATARRDLQELERLGEARRVHGGAVAIGGGRLFEPVFDDKASAAADEKTRIARHAAEMVNAGDTVYLDGGSTVVALARLLREREDITVVTNSLRAAMALADGGPTLILVGGELRRRSQSIVGPLTQPLLQQLHFDTAFMGTMGVSLDDGVTTTDPNEAFTKQAVMGQSTQKVLLADSSKLGEVAFARAGKLADFGTLITDKQAPARFVVAARKIGLNVVLA
jgi:DeoR/GlpR family transcriptional regulator of sugar metabolism